MMQFMAINNSRMKDRKFEGDRSSSEDSGSLSLEYRKEAVTHLPSFSKLHEYKTGIKTNGNFPPKIQFTNMLTDDTLPKKQLFSSKGYCGLNLTAPGKFEISTSPRLGTQSSLYSPRQQILSPKFSAGGERQLFERRIKQMTKDWGTQRTTLRNEIKRLEFIVQQWELLDQRKNGPARSQGKQPPSQPRLALELAKVKKRLEQCQLQKSQMYKDFVELEKELKKVRLHSKESSTSQFRNTSSSRSDSIRHDKEIEQLRADYERIVAQKDIRYQELLADFNALEHELQKQRTDTMLLLQRRTVQLQKSIGNLRQANDEINSQLRSALERASQELQDEKDRSKALENELTHKQQRLTAQEQQVGRLSKNFQDLQEAYMDKCVKLEVSKIQPAIKEDRRMSRTSLGVQTDSNPVRKVDTWMQTLAVKTSLYDIQVQANFQDPNLKSTAALMHNFKDQAQKQTIKVHQLEAAVKQRDLRLKEAQSRIIKTADRQNQSKAIQQLQISCQNLLRDNRRLQQAYDGKTNQVQSLQLKLNKPEKANQQVVSDNFEKDRELAQLRQFKNNATKQLGKVQEELASSRRKAEEMRAQHHDKVQGSANETLVKKTFEITIHNLQSELQSWKLKHDGVQKRLQMKGKELKEKDEFIRSVIVSRTGKQASESETAYLKKKLDELVEISRNKS